MSRWLSMSASRLLDVSFSLPTSVFRWPRLFASYITPSWSNSLSLGGLSSFEPRRLAALLRWPDLDFSFPIVDTVVWSLVSAIESVALVSFLCFYFVFCGCTI